MKLEFMRNKADLTYLSEVVLNTKPLQIDMLIIKKPKDVAIQNEIGYFFKEYNLFEFKSFDDKLNIDTLYKGIAYACLYKAGGQCVDCIKADDITISYIRSRKPQKLFKLLKSQGVDVLRHDSNGIYEIKGQFPFAIQIIVTNELDKHHHIWLTSLKNDLTILDAVTLVTESNKLKEKSDKEYADSVLQVVLPNNVEVFEKIREVPQMCEALMQLMKPEIDAIIAEKDIALAEKDSALAEKDSALAEKDSALAEKDARIKELEILLGL